MTRALALVDGEHYPPVLLEAISELERRGYDVAAAVMLGGHEKLSGPLELGALPIVTGRDMVSALRSGIEQYRPDAVVDLSDAPVIDTRARFMLASVSLAADVAYHGADFTLDVPERPVRTTRTTISVVGTGKRTGKTAVAAALARSITEAGLRAVIVAMGRGGPSEPVVTRGDLERPTVEHLVALAERGEHAASDSYEDAVVAGIATVGARRAGAGLAGAPFVHSVHRAVEVAEGLDPDVVILEGSGTAFPPVAADATVLVVGGATPAVEIAAGLGPYRLLKADLVVVTMCEEPVLSSETISALTSSIRELAREVPVVRTVFRPAPVGSVAGKKIFLATTAPEAVGPSLAAHLTEEHGATVVGVTHRLSDRPRLREDLSRAEGTYDVLLTEVKAAAIDVAARTALASGAEVVFADNEPIAVDGGDLSRAFAALWGEASRAASARRADAAGRGGDARRTSEERG